MTDIILLVILILLGILNLFFITKNNKSGNNEDQNKKDLELLTKEFSRVESQIKDESSRNRTELNLSSKNVREEINFLFKDLSQSVIDRIIENSSSQKTQLEDISNLLDKLTGINEDKLSTVKDTINEQLEKIKDTINFNSKDSRNDLNQALKSFEQEFMNSTKDFNNSQKENFAQIILKQDELNNFTENNLEKVRTTVETKLKDLQENNSKKLDEMRATVDEKLEATIEKRFTNSFNIISERLEQVHKGLGEMQSLATGVGDLKKVLSNVKTRGVMGEYQLESLLEQTLTNDQYSKNVKTNPTTNDHVEFAIKLPGKDKNVWIPIDSKFPIEDYHSLIDAYDTSNLKLIEEAKKKLSNKIKSFAKDIKEKYIFPPNTTDFGIMFLPFESLYAEVLRDTGLFETLQREFKVIVTGPTTISAILNSLQMGFRTLAIEKRSSEVWQLLGAVKTEFGTFGGLLDKVDKKLEEAKSVIDKVGVRSRAIERKLRVVEELPIEDTQKLLPESIIYDHEVEE